MAVRRRRTKKNVVLRICAFVFICYVALTLVDLQTEITRSRRQLAEIETLCEEQRIRNKEVERMLQMGGSDDYIERVARAKSGYAYPDERIFYPISGK